MLRAILAFALALILSLAWGGKLIAYLRSQPWRREVHQAKQGTPSMGGILIVTSAVVAMLVCQPQRETFILSAALIGFGAIGFADDYLKALGGRKGGFKARWKLLAQVALVGLFALVQQSTAVVVPFVNVTWQMPAWAYGAFLFLLVLGACNAANITDGVDGLLASLTLIACLALAVMSTVGVDVPARPNAGVLTFAGALMGACVGFLRFNAHPAQVFMGDTGSLAIGAGVATAAVLLKQELMLPFICFVWVVETLSVMIQVVYFQTTKRLYGEGRRIFRRTPIHHAFELRGWSEWKVVGWFCAVGALVAGVSLTVWVFQTG
ncbi:MAG: phospho-N-acetylmuramoyl-pentapeptide-transferase [Abditibacteriales bacterium]|nr:phospho-N-acetylmuramoyl-pentapeptide-transferase [Abditibacteriales bacterium]